MGLIDKIKKNKSRRQAAINVPNVSADIVAKNEEKKKEELRTQSSYQPEMLREAGNENARANANALPTMADSGAQALHENDEAPIPTEQDNTQTEQSVVEQPARQAEPTNEQTAQPVRNNTIEWNGQGTDPNLSTTDQNYPTGTANNPQQINAANQSQTEQAVTANNAEAISETEKKAVEDLQSLLGEDNMRAINNLPEEQRNYAMARMILEQVKYNNAQNKAELNEENRKKERITKNLASILSMVGALGNLMNAATSRNGRSVEVANIPKVLDENEKEKIAQREKAMERLRKAQQDYDTARSAIIKDAMDRRDRAEKAQADRDAAKERAQIMGAYRADINAQNLAAKAEEGDKNRENKKEIANKDNATRVAIERMRKETAEEKGTGGSGKSKDDVPYRAYTVGDVEYNIDKNDMRRLVEYLPKDLQARIVMVVNKGRGGKETVKMTDDEVDALIAAYVGDTDRHDRGEDERAIWERFEAALKTHDQEYRNKNARKKNKPTETKVAEKNENKKTDSGKKSGGIRRERKEDKEGQKGTVTGNHFNI